jgi:hypothetical protein
MFSLRIEAAGKTTETVWEGAEATLGADVGTTVRREDAGWAPVEAWVWHAGTSLVLVRGDGSVPATLRVGDSIEVGGARVTLTGLLPLLEGEVAGPPARLEAAALPTPAASAVVAPGAPTKVRRPRVFATSRGFDDELVGSLKRAPWLVLSAAVHALVWFVLMLAMPTTAPPPPRPLPRVATIATSAIVDAPVSHPVPLEAPDPFPEPPAAPEIEDVAPERSGGEPALPPPAPELEDPEPMQPPPPTLGTSRSLVSMRVRRAPKPPTETVAGVDVVNYDVERADEHNRRAAAVVLDGVRRGGGSLAKVLKGLRSEDILVVKGTFDEMEKTLDVLSLPYTLRHPYDLEEGYDFARHRAVFWNCGEFPTRLTRAAVAADVRRFVKDGGYLFTTDWMVSNLLIDAFPGMLATSGREHPLPESVLDVQPAGGVERHPLLDGVFLPGSQAKWWLEGSTHDLEIKSPRVETLIESPSLSSSFQRGTAVAVTFTHGRGRVLHLLGHYYQKQGSLAGTIAAQRIALNFIRLRFSRDDVDVAVKEPR